MAERRKAENVLLDTALQEFYGAADEMGLSEKLISILSHAERRLEVSVLTEMDDGSVKVFKGYRVQHSTAFYAKILWINLNKLLLLLIFRHSLKYLRQNLVPPPSGCFLESLT